MKVYTDKNNRTSIEMDEIFQWVLDTYGVETIDRKLMPKYQFSRAKWYEVHLFSKSWDPVQERLDWCEQQFGPQPKRADAWTRWYTMHTTLRFRDEKDYVLFCLRWS